MPTHTPPHYSIRSLLQGMRSKLEKGSNTCRRVFLAKDTLGPVDPVSGPQNALTNYPNRLPFPGMTAVNSLEVCCLQDSYGGEQ